MAKLTLQIEKKESEEIELPLPFFMRNKLETCYIGVLDEKTLVSIDRYDTFVCLVNEDYSKSALSKKKISDAWRTMTHCGETEFMQAFEDALQSITVHPKLAI